MIQPIKDKPSFQSAKRFEHVYQFKITLKEIKPAIWRRIEVPEYYTFWDLHIAITDCMPWLDYHLHQFTIKNPITGQKEELGFPDEEGWQEITPDWETDIAPYFTMKNNKADYLYDFGDCWKHIIKLEKILPREKDVGYPRCIGGKRSCPPEDVGGTGGYEEFLKTISDPEDEECENMLKWAEGLTGQSHFDPERFDPAQVCFDDPDERWEVAFNDGPSI